MFGCPAPPPPSPANQQFIFWILAHTSFRKSNFQGRNSSNWKEERLLNKLLHENIGINWGFEIIYSVKGKLLAVAYVHVTFYSTEWTIWPWFIFKSYFYCSTDLFSFLFDSNLQSDNWGEGERRPQNYPPEDICKGYWKLCLCEIVFFPLSA